MDEIRGAGKAVRKAYDLYDDRDAEDPATKKFTMHANPK